MNRPRKHDIQQGQKRKIEMGDRYEHYRRILAQALSKDDQRNRPIRKCQLTAVVDANGKVRAIDVEEGNRSILDLTALRQAKRETGDAVVEYMGCNLDDTGSRNPSKAYHLSDRDSKTRILVDFL